MTARRRASADKKSRHLLTSPKHHSRPFRFLLPVQISSQATNCHEEATCNDVAVAAGSAIGSSIVDANWRERVRQASRKEWQWLSARDRETTAAASTLEI